MTLMTLDRDVRLTPDEITAALWVLHKRYCALAKSIAHDAANRRAGATIPLASSERHVEELNTVASLIEKLEEARAFQVVQQRIRLKLGLTTEEEA